MALSLFIANFAQTSIASSVIGHSKHIRKRAAVLIALLCIAFSILAQESATPQLTTTSHAEKRSFWSHGIGGLLKKGDDLLRKWEGSGIDTNYIRVPEKDRQIYIGGFGYYQNHSMDFPVMVSESDIPSFLEDYIPSNYNDNRYLSTRMHTRQAELVLGVDWRGLAIEIPISLVNKYSQTFGIAKNGNVWGFRIRYKHLENMNGYVDNAFGNTTATMQQRFITDLIQDVPLGSNHNPVETTRRSINKGNMDLKTFYAEGYYVFNHKKFSLGAGLFADMVQRKRAGSFFAMANYYQSRLECNNMLNNPHDRFLTRKLSIGAGYGYNLPFLDGRLCLHLSIIPMISLLNHLSHTGWSDDMTTEEEQSQTTHGELFNELESMFRSYDQHFYDACDMGCESRFTLNGFNRLAINYSFHRFIITFLANYRQYLFSSGSGVKVGNRELDGQVNFCWRF